MTPPSSPLLLLGLSVLFVACSDSHSADPTSTGHDGHGHAAQEPSAQVGSRSELQIENHEVDLGNVFQQHTYDLEFPFVVAGPDPIVISEIETSCGCTLAGIRPDWDPDFEGEFWPLNREIPAGAKGALVAVFDGSRYERVKSATITVRGNFKSRKVLLKVTAYVQRIFKLTPEQVRFADMRIAQLSGAEVHREIQVVGMEAFELIRWKRIAPGLRVEEVGSPEIQKDGRMTRTFQVTATADLREGRLSSSLIAETSLGVDLEILVNGNLMGAIQYAPSQKLSFGLFDQGQARVRTVKIESSGQVIPTPQFEVLGDAKKVMVADLLTTQAGKLYEIKVNISDTAPAGSYNGILRISFPEASGLQQKEVVLRARIR